MTVIQRENEVLSDKTCPERNAERVSGVGEIHFIYYKNVH